MHSEQNVTLFWWTLTGTKWTLSNTVWVTRGTTAQPVHTLMQGNPQSGWALLTHMPFLEYLCQGSLVGWFHTSLGLHPPFSLRPRAVQLPAEGIQLWTGIFNPLWDRAATRKGEALGKTLDNSGLTSSSVNLLPCKGHNFRDCLAWVQSVASRPERVPNGSIAALPSYVWKIP